MTLPHMCARCGSRDVKSMFRIKGTAVTYDWGEFAAAALFLIFRWEGPTTREKYDVAVPVCAQCLPPLRRAQSTGRVLTISGVLIGAWWLGLKGYGDEFFGPLLWACGGALIGWGAGVVLGRIVKEVTRTQLGSFNGRYFQFCSREFESEFGRLNPGWASPRTRKKGASTPYW